MEAFSAFLKNPRKVHFETQEDDERIIYLLRKHFITNTVWILISIFLFVFPLALMEYFLVLNINTVGVVPLKYQYILVLVWYLLAIIYTLEKFLNWYFNVYIVTNKRIVDIDFWGLLYKNISEAPYENVQDVTYRTGGVFQTLFDYGDVNIQTAAEKREFEFKKVPRPSEVYDKLTDLMEKAALNRSRVLRTKRRKG